MAKNDNLKDFLTDVADAIRAKKGTSAAINPQDFSAEIASIETGGGGAASGSGQTDVRFLDCDGTLLHSFSKDEFLTLDELPSLPTRQGLICQGWNYSIADAKAYVEEYGVLDIGATYITDDGKTRLYITIAAAGRMTVPLYFSQSVANGVTIDWGDGSATKTLSGTGVKNTSHTYAAIGDYVITLKVTSGTLVLGFDASSLSVMGNYGNNGKVYCNMLRKVEIGSGVTSIGNFTFYNCYSLASVVIPSGVTSIGNYTFGYCYSLASVVIPSGVTSIGVNAFYYCYSLDSVVIPSGVTSIGAGTFFYCYSLDSVVIPSSVTSIGASTFYYCYSLDSVVIPSGVTSIGTEAFYNCNSLASVVIPSSVTSIESTAFYYCYSLASVVIPSSVTSIAVNTFGSCGGMAYYDFRSAKSVPTLSNTNGFYGIPSDCKIVVPDDLYDTWKAATNWSSYASKIIKASEYNG